MKKIRLDELVVEQGLADTVDIAQRLIMAGEVRTGDRVWEKAGEKVPRETYLELKSQHCKWVSRGGLKLERAFESFNFSPAGMRCLDIGASTGGFTHVLLENNALSVIALDVGNGLLDPRIKNDERVTVKDKTNFRLMEANALGEPFDLVVTDVSFISLRMILPKAAEMLNEQGSIIALIKPQFEAPRGMVPTGGVITDPEAHLYVVRELLRFMSENTKLRLIKLEPVPLISKKKNIEFVSLWQVNEESLGNEAIRQIIEQAHSRTLTR